MSDKTQYDLIVVGAGASGIIAAIIYARKQKNVLLIEQLPNIATKLKATGGGRCNLSNTLDNDTFIKAFGLNGKFIKQSILNFNHKDLQHFLLKIGVKTHIPDGFHIFPTTHNSTTIIEAFQKELLHLNVTLKLKCKLDDLIVKENTIIGVTTSLGDYYSKNLILATGGMGYRKLGATGEVFKIIQKYNHIVTPLYPAMMPLNTKEKWVANCTANTMPNVTIEVNLPKIKKLKKLKAIGDLIFTKNGIRGPVVLDFAREITPYLDKFNEVPIIIRFNKDQNENKIIDFIKKEIVNDPNKSISQIISNILPVNLAVALCKSIDIDPNIKYKQIIGNKKDKLHKILVKTPLHIVGHDGFSNAMITRGGICLKQIDENNMQSKIINGLYFCGEMVNIDGPCGGYNLQWAFSSGVLCAGTIG